MHGRIRTTGRGSASRGITLVEMMVVLVVVSIGWLALTAVSIETMRTFEFFQAMNLLEVEPVGGEQHSRRRGICEAILRG